MQFSNLIEYQTQLTNHNESRGSEELCRADGYQSVQGRRRGNGIDYRSGPIDARCGDPKIEHDRPGAFPPILEITFTSVWRQYSQLDRITP